MARLITAGAETKDKTAEALTSFSGTYDATVSYSPGLVSFKNSSADWVFTGATATTYFLRIHYRHDADEGADNGVVEFRSDATTVICTIAVDTAGFLYLRDQAGVQIGSKSSVAMGINAWHLIELAVKIGTGAIDYAEARLNGVSMASTTTGNFSDVAPTRIRLTAPTTANTWRDDVALNDDTGANQNSWPAEGTVVLLLPTADSAVGTGWTLGTGTAISGNSGSTAVKNTAPVGVADLAAGSDTKQIRNASANANVSYDATMTTYAAAGLTPADKVNIVVPIIATAAPVSTGAKQGTVGVVSNPAITNIALGAGGTSGAFWSGAAGAGYPTGWKISYGTFTYSPSVIVSTAPVMRVTQVTSSTRIAVVCFMGMYVDYTPGVNPHITIIRQAVNRGAVI